MSYRSVPIRDVLKNVWMASNPAFNRFPRLLISHADDLLYKEAFALRGLETVSQTAYGSSRAQTCGLPDSKSRSSKEHRGTLVGFHSLQFRAHRLKQRRISRVYQIILFVRVFRQIVQFFFFAHGTVDVLVHRRVRSIQHCIAGL